MGGRRPSPKIFKGSISSGGPLEKERNAQVKQGKQERKGGDFKKKEKPGIWPEVSTEHTRNNNALIMVGAGTGQKRVARKKALGGAKVKPTQKKGRKQGTSMSWEGKRGGNEIPGVGGGVYRDKNSKNGRAEKKPKENSKHTERRGSRKKKKLREVHNNTHKRVRR